MTIKAKEVLDGKFWIVEDEGVNIGTLSFDDEKYMLNDTSGKCVIFNNEQQVSKNFGSKILWSKLNITETVPVEKSVHGMPTSCTPYSPIYDVKRKLPMFSKSNKSKSLYCAGYFIIRFDKGWVKSFCPKLITIERYECKGPFKTEIEMRTELSRVNNY
mgnify:FL=1|jgi:hypothetical protein|tara:strand:+ start:1524 stop:2000 length:477 start_codon:yes stop_codon:yes gene_type:complete